MPTRETFLKLAKEAFASADEHGRLREMMLKQGRTLLAMADQALPSTQQQRSMVRSKMELETPALTKSARIAAGRTKREHPAKRIWLEAGKTDSDIAVESAKALGVKKIGRSTVSAWMATGSGFRPPPRKLAEHFERKYGIPLEAWPRLGD